LQDVQGLGFGQTTLMEEVLLQEICIGQQFSVFIWHKKLFVRRMVCRGLRYLLKNDKINFSASCAWFDSDTDTGYCAFFITYSGLVAPLGSSPRDGGISLRDLV
jgi:hypothetical protein